jgi:hypothetical protein
MKALKYFLSAILLISVVWSCTKDNFGDIDFINSVQAPANISALYNVAQDNTGFVTITPNGDGVITYDVYFGDTTTAPVNIKQGEAISHTYNEGNYDVKIVGNGITGLKAEVTQALVVSFKAPENLAVTIANDLAISKQVNVSATADFASSFDVYFGETTEETPVTANIGETASFVYQTAGKYTIRVVAKGAAIATTEFSQEFEATAILQPIASASTPPTKNAIDVISIYGDAFTNVAGTNYNPDWGQSGQGSGFAEYDLNGDKMLQYINLSYQGIALADGTTADASAMEFLHMDVWTADVTDLEISLINTTGEKPVSKPLKANEWNSLEIPLSDYTSQGLSLADLIQLKLVGTPWAGGSIFVDNIYFYKSPTVTSSVLDGTWKIAPEAGALKVGPSAGNGDWWTSDAQAVIDRACFFDDTYVFNSDGSFRNVLGTDTWLEGWQGTADACGTPVAPHNGTAGNYTYDANAGTVTINGTGAYLGIPKANNAGELPNVAVPTSITYNIVLSDNDNTMNLVIETGTGVFWSFKLVRETAMTPPPVEGTWKIAPEAGALKVGPSAGNGDWWTSDAQAVIDRACFFDDTYVFSNGSFSNVLGSDTWLEGWQGTTDACGTPVAPYDGTAVATYTYDGSAGKITLNGTGAYLGIPKANNAGELPNVAVPTSITYDIVLSNNDNTMNLVIEAGAGVFWSFKLVREGTSSGGGGSTSVYNLTLPIDFESSGFGANWSWNVFENDTNPALEFVANPSVTGINTSSTVAKITALQAGQAWVGTETAHGEMGITWDLSASNAIIKIMVYKTVISDVGIKLVNPAGGAQVEIKVPNTKINQWEELTFDFSSRIGNGLDGSTNIDQIVVFPDFDLGGRTSDNIVYFDNITFSSN